MTLVRRLSPLGDMTFGQGLSNFAEASEACAQNVKTRLLLILGEWFLDTSAGVPYLQQILTKPAQLPLAEAVLKKTIKQTTDVDSITSFFLTLDRDKRKLTVAATVRTIYGDIKDIKVEV